MSRFPRNTASIFLVLIVLCVCSPALSDTGADPFANAQVDLEQVDFRALKMAIRDLMQTFPDEYGMGEEYMRIADSLEQRLPEIREALRRRDASALEQVRRLVALERQALLSNPLLDFDRLLLIKRRPLDDPRRASCGRSRPPTSRTSMISTRAICPMRRSPSSPPLPSRACRAIPASTWA